MRSRRFSLEPFPSEGLPQHLKITGNIGRNSNKLSVLYTLSGPLAELMVPAHADVPLRRDGLWKETCFEFFLGPVNSDHYWEFNLSPSGHWNVYSFTSYREGMQEEPVFKNLPFCVLLHSDSLQLSLEVEMDKLVPSDRDLKINISAVIKTINGRTTFWALTHPGPQADFHRKDGFIIDL